MMENSYVIIKKYISKGIAEKWDPRRRTQNLGLLSETKDLDPLNWTWDLELQYDQV